MEFPSQFNEHWALEPSVFAHYARHHETGAPMPLELVARLKRARTFNQGFAMGELVQAMLLAATFPLSALRGRTARLDHAYRLAGALGKLSFGAIYPLYRRYADGPAT